MTLSALMMTDRAFARLCDQRKARAARLEAKQAAQAAAPKKDKAQAERGRRGGSAKHDRPADFYTVTLPEARRKALEAKALWMVNNRRAPK